MDKSFLDIFSSYNQESLTDNQFKKSLKEIESGFLIGQKNGIPNVRIINPLDWLKVDSFSSTAQWHFHRLGGGCGFLLSRFTIHIGKILNSIIINWIRANRLTNGFPNNAQAWSGHTVGLRLDFISCYYLTCHIYHYDISDKNELIKSMKEHIDHLIKKSNYDGHWNHGLDQSIGLLKASYLISNTEGIACAIDRIKENFHNSFNLEGVNIEQSTMYHDYNIHRYQLVFNLLNTIDVEVPNIDSMAEKANLFLLHSLDPNGCYSMIGDTVFKNPIKENRNSYIHYLMSKGKSGSVPTVNPKRVYHAGYVFGRSSWNSAKNPSYYTLRFGPKRLVHGHNDHMNLTYFCDGSNVLIDGGFHGYKGKGDKLRAFLLSPNAHNVVFSKDYKKYNWDLPTVLINSFQSSSFDFYTFFDKPYEGVKRFRNIMIDVDNDFFLVFDQISSIKSSEFIQSWNVGPCLDIESSCNTVTLYSDQSSFKLVGDDSSQMSIIRGSIPRLNDDNSIIGGYAGLGHNHVEEINTIHYEKTGNNIEWYTAFFKSTSGQYIKIDRNSFLFKDNFYKLIHEDGWIKAFKSVVVNSFLDYYELKVSFNSILNISDNKICIENLTAQRHYFDINFNSFLTGDIHALLIDLNIECQAGEEPTYFYTSVSSGKKRFNTVYFYSNSSDDVVVRIPINPDTKVSLTMNVRELRVVKEIIFPCAHKLINTITEIL